MYQRRTQGEPSPDTVFSQAYSLYQACRKSGTWAKLVLECGENGEEVFSFSSKRFSGQTSSPLTSSIKPTPPTMSTRRKTPSKWRKDRVKWRAWLGRKLEDSKDPRREEDPSQSGACKAVPPTSNSRCVPADSVVEVQCVDRCTIHLQGDQGNSTLSLHSPVPPPSTPAGDEDVLSPSTPAGDEDVLSPSTPAGDEDKNQEKPPVDRACIDPEECSLTESGEEGGISVPTPAPPTRILRSQSRSRSVTPSRANTTPNLATPTHRGRIPATSNIQGSPVKKGVCFHAMPRSEWIALSQKKKKKKPLNQEK